MGSPATPACHCSTQPSEQCLGRGLLFLFGTPNTQGGPHEAHHRRVTDVYRLSAPVSDAGTGALPHHAGPHGRRSWRRSARLSLGAPASYPLALLRRGLGALWEDRRRAPQSPDGAGRGPARGILGWPVPRHRPPGAVHAPARQTRRGHPRGWPGIKKAPDTCPGASSEFASPAMAHELCLNPLNRQGSQACPQQYHILTLPHKPRRLRILPATKTRRRWVSARRVTLVGTFPHAPRLEPDVRLSPHTAQHSQIRLGLRSVAWCAYRLKVIHAISLR